MAWFHSGSILLQHGRAVNTQQERLFGDASVDELYEQAQKHWQRSQE